MGGEGNKVQEYLQRYFEGAETPAVLTVDDGPLNLAMFRMQLPDCFTKLGIERQPEILERLDGNSAMEILKQTNGRVFLVITDGDMPKMDGIELVRGIRAQGDNKVTTLLVSGEGESSETVREARTLLETGELDGYLLKPYKKPALEEAIREAIEHRLAMLEAAKQGNL